YAPEIDSVRAALEWAFSTEGDPAIGVGLCGSSGGIWLELALRREGAQRLEAALARMGAQTPEREEARLWSWLASLWLSTPGKTAIALERAIELYRRIGDAVGLAYSLMRLGNELTFQGHCEEAEAVCAELLPLLESIARPKILAEYLLGIGYREMLSGHHASGRPIFERSASLCREGGTERVAIGVVQCLAEVNWTCGDLEAALAGFREAAA